MYKESKKSHYKHDIDCETYYNKYYKYKKKYLALKQLEGGSGLESSDTKVLNRSDMFKEPLLININDYVRKFSSFHDIFDKILFDNKLLLFKDMHGHLEHIYYVLSNLQFLKQRHNFNVLFIEMLPLDFEIEFKLNDEAIPLQDKIKSVVDWFSENWNSKSDHVDLSSNTAYQCLVIYAMYFGYQIYGCDDLETYKETNPELFDRYSMNKEISKKIHNVLEGKKGIGFFGAAHLNMRTTSYQGIPYYLNFYHSFTDFLVLDILNKQNNEYGTVGIITENTDVTKNEFGLIKTNANVDYPNYFIVINDDSLKTKIKAVCLNVNINL